MTNDVVKIRSHTLRILLLQSEDNRPAVTHYYGMFKHIPDLTDYNIAQARLQTLQTKLKSTKKSQGDGKGNVSLGPVHAFLQTEWENLAETVSSLLENAFQPPQDLFASVHITPSFISELETRANHLQMYQEKKCSDSPLVYCLSAFANPRGFLASLIRETAHTEQDDVSKVDLHFQVYYKILQ